MRIRGGANNRVYRVKYGGRDALLKSYFRLGRLNAEFSFLKFAWDRGIRAIPRPLARDRRRRWGLYEWVRGRHLRPGEIGRPHVEQALAFYRRINRHRREPAARRLPRAAEACFSLAEHLACVERRIRKLKRIGGRGRNSPEEQARRFVMEKLAPAWRRCKRWVQTEARRRGIPLRRRLPRRDWRLSPSDFGFHNALKNGKGALRFLDFEYAGWDDPAKMTCDFFCQPKVPVPASLRPLFERRVAEDLQDPAGYRDRVSLLLPVYRIKWCCILLNEFLPGGWSRRRFAGARDGPAARLRQLAASRRYLRAFFKTG